MGVEIWLASKRLDGNCVLPDVVDLPGKILVADERKEADQVIGTDYFRKGQEPCNFLPLFIYLILSILPGLNFCFFSGVPPPASDLHHEF
jgi:hypothetical protein